jgi:hypothetical protein
MIETPEVEQLEDAISDASAEDNSRDGAVARMDVYVEWLLTPRTLRVPQLKKDLATQLGISAETLRRYDHDPWMRREYLKRSRAAFTVSRASEVVETLYKRATDPHDPQGVTAAKTLMQFMAQQDEAEESDSVDLSKMTTDDLVALALKVAGAKS